MTVDELLTKLDSLPGEAQVFMMDEENFVIDIDYVDIENNDGDDQVILKEL